MIELPCPWCGPRNVTEFRYSGEVTPRPDPATATPQEWRDYLYLRRNTCGWVDETWYHSAGCRRFFRVERETVSNRVRTGGRQPAERAEPAGWVGTAGEAR